MGTGPDGTPGLVLVLGLGLVGILLVVTIAELLLDGARPVLRPMRGIR